MYATSLDTEEARLRVLQLVCDERAHNFFSDSPFNHYNFYKTIAAYFPNAVFIYTYRNDSSAWLNRYTKDEMNEIVLFFLLYNLNKH